MLAKLLGIMLILVGGYLSLHILFPLLGNILDTALLLLKLVIPVVLIYVGYRLLDRDDSY